MHISFSPQRRDTPLDLDRSGDVLIVNGEVFDFSSLPEGATLPAGAIESDWFNGPVRRENGSLYLTLALPHGPHAPVETRFPAPVFLECDGPVTLPAYEGSDNVQD